MAMRRLLVTFIAAWSAAAGAEGTADGFRNGDAALGEPIASRDCNACHARRFEGDADRIYQRPDRKVRSAAQLMAQIRYCNTELGAGYFPEEEEHIAAYLNNRYYHFQ
jgi:hypothetical protein